METQLCRDCAGRGHALELVWDHCTDCDGTGEIESKYGGIYPCEDCYGKGTIRHHKPGEICIYCNGSGILPNPCSDCQDKKIVKLVRYEVCDVCDGGKNDPTHACTGCNGNGKCKYYQNTPCTHCQERA